jgi:hypothetical protein
LAAEFGSEGFHFWIAVLRKLVISGCGRKIKVLT